MLPGLMLKCVIGGLMCQLALSGNDGKEPPHPVKQPPGVNHAAGGVQGAPHHSAIVVSPPKVEHPENIPRSKSAENDEHPQEEHGAKHLGNLPAKGGPPPPTIILTPASSERDEHRQEHGAKHPNHPLPKDIPRPKSSEHGEHHEVNSVAKHGNLPAPHEGPSNHAGHGAAPLNHNAHSTQGEKGDAPPSYESKESQKHPIEAHNGHEKDHAGHGAAPPNHNAQSTQAKKGDAPPSYESKESQKHPLGAHEKEHKDTHHGALSPSESGITYSSKELQSAEKKPRLSHEDGENPPDYDRVQEVDSAERRKLEELEKHEKILESKMRQFLTEAIIRMSKIVRRGYSDALTETREAFKRGLIFRPFRKDVLRKGMANVEDVGDLTRDAFREVLTPSGLNNRLRLDVLVLMLLEGNFAWDSKGQKWNVRIGEDSDTARQRRMLAALPDIKYVERIVTNAFNTMVKKAEKTIRLIAGRNTANQRHKRAAKKQPKSQLTDAGKKELADHIFKLYKRKLADVVYALLVKKRQDLVVKIKKDTSKENKANAKARTANAKRTQKNAKKTQKNAQNAARKTAKPAKKGGAKRRAKRSVPEHPQSNAAHPQHPQPAVVKHPVPQNAAEVKEHSKRVLEVLTQLVRKIRAIYASTQVQDPDKFFDQTMKELKSKHMIDNREHLQQLHFDPELESIVRNLLNNLIEEHTALQSHEREAQAHFKEQDWLAYEKRVRRSDRVVASMGLIVGLGVFTGLLFLMAPGLAG